MRIKVRKKYSIILADCPWSFKSWSDKGKNRAPDFMVNQKGLSERHYKVMDAEDLCSLKVSGIAAKDCVLFLWCVDCMIPEAIKLGTHWGFTFKTVAFTWVKQTKSKGYHVGLGYWTRGNPEMCLMFTRGKPKKVSSSVRQLVITERQRHSAKPPEVRDRIVELLGDLPRVELFARERCEGWTSIGLEIDGRDIREVLK